MDCIFLIVGKSGSGKDTLINEICKRYTYQKLISYTTRPKRYNNENTHIFISNEEFSALQDIVAYTEFNGYKYCATSEQVDNADFYIIDPDGVEYFLHSYKGKKRTVIINITASKFRRFIRMLKRGDGIKSTIKRILYDDKKFSNQSYKYNYIVKNENLNVAIYQIMQAVSANASW